jgi:F0F1-type ATP synthase membrane subunit a
LKIANLKFLLREFPALLIGGVIGVIISLAAAGSIDVFFPGQSEGWVDSVAKSIESIFGKGCAEQKIVVYSGTAFVFIFIMAMGFFIGSLFGLAVERFFSAIFKRIN